MSILIPGLKMPPTMGISIIIDCGQVWIKPFGARYPEKWDRQAIELPPHGRLIDADELESMCGEPYWSVSLGKIQLAPTIIEAEGVDE